MAKKVRKIQPFTKKWERLANDLTRLYTNIRPCRHCGYPIIDGYCCETCESNDP